MQRKTWVRPLVMLAALALAPVALAGDSSDIAGRTAPIDGMQIHYLKAGSGPAVLLIHGYTQTSRMWKPIIPALAKRFTVIAPDLPGIGDSSIPEDGLDLKTAAVRLHALVRSLGFQKASVVGHDIGLMVAYGYAALYPAETEKLAVLDAFVPGIGAWEMPYNDPGIWHFRFNGPTPELLVKGRERIYLDSLWNGFAADKNRAISSADRAAYAESYARPGRMRAGWGYFVSFPKVAKEFAELSRAKLTMPVLSIGGEKAFGEFLGQQMKVAATNVTVEIVKGSGHWLMEEKPQETMEALARFL